MLSGFHIAFFFFFKGNPKEEMSASNEIATLCPMDLDYLAQWL